MSRKRHNNEKPHTSASKKRNTSQGDEESDDTEMVDSTDRLNNNALMNRSGKINKIILKNFMCHSNLVIEFNKNVNLLIGNNGSGKSAILTALIVGLGSKSSATSRCTNIGQLIKRGETSGSVVIHIANNCEQGYDRETFGSEIIVQRTFSSDGSSAYRIKKSSGQIISSSRKDLMKILLFMNIQVDNPVCVLNQDANRAFLEESDPKKRFKFFLKATQIDTVIEKLNDCSSHYASGKKQLEYQKNILVSLKEELDKIQTKFDSLQSIGFLKKTLSKYKVEFAWLKVQNEEELQTEIMKTRSKYQEVYDKLIASMNERQSTESGRKYRCDLLTGQINELKEDMRGDVERKNQIRRNIAKDEEARNDVQRQLQQIIKKIAANHKNCAQLENDMSESSESLLIRWKDPFLLKVIVMNPPTEMFPAPSLRTYALQKQQPRYLQVNMKQRKEYLMNDIREVNDRLTEVNEEIEADEAKKNEFAKNLTLKLSLGDTLEDKLRTNAQSIKQLEKIEYPGENEREMLQAELEELRRAYTELEKEQISVKQRVDEMDAAIEVKRRGMKDVDKNINLKTEKIEEKQLEIYAENDLTAEQTANTNSDQRKAAKIKGELEKLQKQEQDCNNKLKTLTLTASNLAGRVEINNSEDFLTSKIKETEKIIKTVSDSKDSLEEVEQLLELKSTEYEERKDLVDNLEKTLIKKIMKLRQYDGSITIDHQKELLELSVVPRDQHIANSVSSANCLSGGERSFSTVAFLLALWSVVDSPFDFLDEYDVYTDAINRYYMTKLLLNEAKKKQQRQYTFLTPQDMSEIIPGNDLSIQRLADPIRT